jgi:hypothetical protein
MKNVETRTLYRVPPKAIVISSRGFPTLHMLVFLVLHDEGHKLILAPSRYVHLVFLHTYEIRCKIEVYLALHSSPLAF